MGRCSRLCAQAFLFVCEYAILSSLPPPALARKGGVLVTLSMFILSILAGVIANYISKRLDERDDGNEPRH